MTIDQNKCKHLNCSLIISLDHAIKFTASCDKCMYQLEKGDKLRIIKNDTKSTK